MRRYLYKRTAEAFPPLAAPLPHFGWNARNGDPVRMSHFTDSSAAWCPQPIFPPTPSFGWNQNNVDPARPMRAFISASLAWVPQVIAPSPSPQSWNFVTLADGATINWPVAGNEVANAEVTLGGNRTLNLTGAANGGSYVLIITQDGTGSRTLVLPGTWKFSGGGGLQLSTAPGAVDVLAFTFDGSVYYATLGPAYS